MTNPRSQSSYPPSALLFVWLALAMLTFASLGLGKWLHGGPWLSVLVAGVIWFKAWLVGRYFLEAPRNHPFIRRLIWTFIAFVPVALVFTAVFGRQFAAWVQL